MARLVHGFRFVPGDEGDLFYRASNGDLVHLPIPADHATVDYVLGIVSGVPAWIVSSGVTPASPVTVEDGSGGFLIVFDEDGNVVYA